MDVSGVVDFADSVRQEQGVAKGFRGRDTTLGHALSQGLGVCWCFKGGRHQNTYDCFSAKAEIAYCQIESCR
jgi:hypothetical protein